jgi:hypothetical protein
MPVKYDPYRSMYVSRKSPEIAQMLEQRFASNMAAQDELQQKLLELQAAPFEGDGAARAKLYNDTKTQLEQMAQRGDYENMTMQVAKLARNYENTAYPIAYNQKLFAEDQAVKQEQLAKGVITKEMYDKWMQSTQYRFDNDSGDYVRYSGIQFDGRGAVNPTSYYTPTQLAPFVDVQGEIIEQLNQLDEVKSGGYSVKGYERPGDGSIEYVITRQGQFVEKVPEQLVEQVTRGVLNRSDVRSYMEQDARFNLMTADEATVNSVLASGLRQMQSSGDQSNQEKAMQIRQTLQTGTLGEKRKMAEQVKYDQEYTSMFNMGMNVRTPSRYGGRNEMEYSPLYLAAVKAANERNGTDPTGEDRLLFAGSDYNFISPFADPNTGVASPQSIQAGIESAMRNQVTATERIHNMIPEMRDVSSDELLEMLSTMSPADVIKFGQEDGLDARDIQIIEQARQAIHLQNVQIQIAQRMQEAAYADVGFTAPEVARQSVATVLNDLGTDQTMSDVFAEMLDGENPEVAAAGIAARVHADIAINRTPVAQTDTLGVVSSMVQEITGLDEETARRVSSEGIASGYRIINVGADPLTVQGIQTGAGATAAQDRTQNSRVADHEIPLSSDLEAVINDIVQAHRETALARNSSFNSGLQEVSRGTINFPNIEFRNGTEPYKVANDVRNYFKNNDVGIADLSQAADFAGRPLATALLSQLEIDPSDYSDNEEMLRTAKVRSIQFTRGMHSDGSVRPMLALKFGYTPSGETSEKVSNAIKVPFEQLVPYDQGLSKLVSGVFNTPADAALNEVYTQLNAAPGVVTTEGAFYSYSDPAGNNFQFRFVPSIGMNGIMTGWNRIEVMGYSAALGRQVNHVYASESEFISSFNTLVAISTGQVPTNDTAE